MILHVVVLHLDKTHLEAVVEDAGKPHRVALSWFDREHRLPAEWFKSVEEEVRFQQKQSRVRDPQGQEPL